MVELEDKDISATSSSSSTTDVQGKKPSYKEDKQVRMQKMNDLKKNKREMSKLEKDIEKLKEQVIVLEKEIEKSSDEGWTKLAELTDKMNLKNESIDEKEMRWLELAELLEEAEAE